MTEHGWITLAAIASLAAFELVALLKGINGRLLVAISAIIAALAGVSIDRIITMVSTGG